MAMQTRTYALIHTLKSHIITYNPHRQISDSLGVRITDQQT